MSILLTGFNPFAGLETNPSQLIVTAIEDRAKRHGYDDVISSVLKTEYQAAEYKIRQLLREIQPLAWIGLGVAMGSGSIQLEREAANLDDTDMPDNSGDLRLKQPIIPNGPDIYRSTLPLLKMHDALKSRGIPSQYSNNAGAYICNHVFYTAIHEVNQLGLDAKCGFIHVPLMSLDTEKPTSHSSGLPLQMMVEGIECCISVLRDIEH